MCLYCCCFDHNYSYRLFFCFQAEDGIRVFHVTGVQTCALPISVPPEKTWKCTASRSLPGSVRIGRFCPGQPDAVRRMLRAFHLPQHRGVEMPLKFRLEALTYNDGTRISLDENAVIVLVGPNNAGKSATLREIRNQCANEEQMVVLGGVELRKEGTPD